MYVKKIYREETRFGFLLVIINRYDVTFLHTLSSCNQVIVEKRMLLSQA